MYATYYDGYRPFEKMDLQKTEDIRNKLLEMFEVYHRFIENSVFKKRNILSDDSNGTLAGIIIAIIIAIGTTAFSIGQFTSDVKNYRLENENRQLKKELSTSKAKHGLTKKIITQ